MNPLISIIMPLYNAERFLGETLYSVSKQTFSEYELICINDGSDDNTVNIVQEFQEKDSRIKLLSNKKHSGAATARNMGIREAIGKYLVFLDGDDIFDEDMLRLSFNKAEEQSADIVMFEYRHVASEQIYEKQFVTHSIEYRNKFCKKTISVNDIKLCDFIIWSSSPCNKLFKKKFIDQNCLEFQNLSNNNDTYFVDMAFLVAERMIVLDSFKVMVYARDHFTPGRISTERDPMCTYLAMMKIKEELKRRGILHRFHKIYNYNAFNYMIIGLKSTQNMERREKFFKFLVDGGFDDLLESYGNENEVEQFLVEKKNEFITIGLQEGWKQTDFVYEVFLQENLDEISKIFEKCKLKNKRLGVWGIGRLGRRFIQFCIKYNLHIDIVIDKDEKKQGVFCEGYQIQSPPNVSNIDIVLTVLGCDASISIKKMVQSFNKNAKVIDLNAVICYY